LTQAIKDILSDKPKPGSPPKFSAEEVVNIIAVGCEDPKKSDRPISHWTYRELADEVIKRKIVETVSASSVWRFLKRGTTQTS